MTEFGVSVSAVLAVSVAIVATFAWRALGAALTQRISPEGLVFRWFSLASYAVLAGLLARLLILPTGDLATVDLTVRLAAAAIALAAFFLARRSLLAGIAAGTASFAAGAAFLS